MKPDKKEKKRLKRKDFEKKKNILKAWQKRTINRLKNGEDCPLMPVHFKRPKKNNKINK